MGGKSQNSKKEEIIRENIIKKAARKQFRAKREKQMLENRPVLNRQDTRKKYGETLLLQDVKWKKY